MLKAITIQRFKNIKNAVLPLDRINILIGANNSGKSSLLQAIQFSVSAAQTLRMLNIGWDTSSDTSKWSFPATELVYVPLQNVELLSHNHVLSEKATTSIDVTFTQQSPLVQNGDAGIPDISTVVKVYRGRGQFIQCSIKGSEIGKTLQSQEKPYSIFVPGLAGIPLFEEQKAAVTVRRAAARGDANNVFRNVLYLLKQSSTQWLQFQTDFQNVFPGKTIEVDFDRDQDEYIQASIISSGIRFPIDAAGTGILQAIQILAYINWSQPNLIILDEPDAHLHPDNQRRLAKVLIDIAALRDFQIILSTHSRHLLESFNNYAKMHWIRDGQRVPDVEYSNISVLFELGALDRGDLLKSGKIKCVVLTEDSDDSGIKALVEAAGFSLIETDIWSYRGCSNQETALALCNVLLSYAPGIKIVIHRDRDYFTNDEVESYRKNIENVEPTVSVFITTGTDTESGFLSAEHIHQLEAKLEISKITDAIERASSDRRSASIEKFINARSEIENRKLRKINKQLNHGELASDCYALYDREPMRYRHGKLVLKKLRDILGTEYGLNPDPFRSSSHIVFPELKTIAEAIWSTTSSAGSVIAKK